ncbi:MAG: hypothetical protein GC157_03400 [Frankiales bacterium]|nr:hypothetical protein [Frankiales bacterium]
MFIIWGWRERQVILAARDGMCGQFFASQHHRLIARKGWLTLFWIPIIPYRKKPRWYCWDEGRWTNETVPWREVNQR